MTNGLVSLARGVSIVSSPIFISYSSKDREIAETICQALESRGYNCWISCRDVRPGENFQEAIVHALRSAKVMLLVFTSNANNSDEIKKELVLAGRHRVTVVPVRVEDVVPNDAFTYEFATRQWVDLFKDWEREIEQLATQLGPILQAVKPLEGDAATATSLPSKRAVKRSSSNQLVIASIALVAVVLFAGAVVYLKPWGKTSPAVSPSIATQAPAAIAQPPAPAQPPSAVSPPAPAVEHAPAAPIAPPPALVSPPDPDEAAWRKATGAGTRAAFAEYLNDFSAGVHGQEAQLRIVDLILSAPATAKNFDGVWQTTWTCLNVGQYPGYSYRFNGQVKDGAYHGMRGVKGEPGSMVLDGKIESDGTAAFFGEIIVGSSVVALGAARGTQSDYHALAKFDRTSGAGKRIEGRQCSLAFARPGTPAAAAAPEQPAFTNQILKVEPAIGQLPPGAKVLIDDGTCPAGKLKQVVGGNVTTGQARLRSCVPRP